jgi:hypothetical protein
MAMPLRLRTFAFWIALTLGGANGQQTTPTTSPTSKASLTRVRTGRTCGWCSGFGYRTQETTIESGWITSVSRDAGDRKSFPNIKQKQRITKADWEELERIVDAQMLASSGQQSASCLSCRDLPEAWIGLEFSDGTKKGITYSPGTPPPGAGALLDKVRAISAKRLKPQLFPAN